MCPLVASTAREEVTKKYGIKDNCQCCGFFLLGCCCPHCSVCQTYRELTFHGDSPGMALCCGDSEFTITPKPIQPMGERNAHTSSSSSPSSVTTKIPHAEHPTPNPMLVVPELQYKTYVPPSPNANHTPKHQQQPQQHQNDKYHDPKHNKPNQHQSKNNSTQSKPTLVNDFDTVCDVAPVPQVFKRGVPEHLSFQECVAAALSLRELPKDEKGNITRPDMAGNIPDDSDVACVLREVEKELVLLKKRKAVQDLMIKYRIADDDIRALWLYKAEEPYPVYAFLNMWMMGQRRDAKIKQTIGPLFVRIYRAMEKLPKITCQASRGVLVKNIPALRNTFDHYRDRCSPGQIVSFWGFSSFSRDDAVGATKFAGDHSEDAIVYSCPSLIGVDMEPFAPSGMQCEEEILPMCPAVFECVNAVKVLNTKLVVTLKQKNHDDYAYVVPK